LTSRPPSGWPASGTSSCRGSSAWQSRWRSSGNELDAAAKLAERHGDSLARERVLVYDYLTGRARLRIARGDVREGLTDLLRCGELLEAHGTGGLADWRSDAARALAELGDGERAEGLAREGLAAARAFGAPRTLGRALRAAGRVIGGDEGLDLLEEAVTVVEPSPARLEAAYAYADLGPSWSRAGDDARAARCCAWRWKAR
jgi:hypothetical protein